MKPDLFWTIFVLRFPYQKQSYLKIECSNISLSRLAEMLVLCRNKFTIVTLNLIGIILILKSKLRALPF